MGTISIISPTISVSGPPSPPERDFRAEQAADQATLEQAAKEFFKTREAFAAAIEIPGFPLASVRYGRLGGRQLFFSRSLIATWMEKQRALVATFK